MKKSKRISKSHAVTIPREIRQEVGFLPGMAVDIETKGKSIIIRPHTPTCRFCGAVKDVVEVYNMSICTNCAEGIIRRAKYGGTTQSD